LTFGPECNHETRDTPRKIPKNEEISGGGEIGDFKMRLDTRKHSVILVVKRIEVCYRTDIYVVCTVVIGIDSMRDY
jgi:hypothetical protein